MPIETSLPAVMPGVVTALPLPDGAAGAWVEIVARAGTPGFWVQVAIDDAARGHVVRELYLGPVKRGRGGYARRTLVHVPAQAGAARLLVWGEGPVAIGLRVLPRWMAALALLAAHGGSLPRAWAGSPFGRSGRLRLVLGLGPAWAGEAPPYALWRAAVGEAPAPEGPAWPGVSVVLWPGEADLLRASRAAVIAAGVDEAAIFAPDEVPAGRLGWHLLLAAGELPRPGGIAALARAATPGVQAVFGDYDQCDIGGAEGAGASPERWEQSRADPVLRPPPESFGVASGLFARGMAAFCTALPPVLPASADAARHMLALATPAGGLARVAALVCSRDTRTGAAGPAVLAQISASGLMARQGLGTPPGGMSVDCMGVKLPGGGALVRVRRRLKVPPMVSVIVPSAARGAHVLPCLRALSAALAGVPHEILLSVSRVDSRDRGQRAVLAQAAGLANLRVIDLAMRVFNYAAVNNAAARQARGEMLLLMNDDVAFIDSAGLQSLLAVAALPDVAAAGARLLYGNAAVQHAGVVLGLGGLAEHAGRGRPGDDGGPGGIFLAERAVSAVTAAAMMLRRGNFEAACGFDEGFAIALNDVDLCLRLARQGAIVLVAGCEAWHYEQVSLGRHYSGARAGLESTEVGLLRARHGALIAQDPWYHPQASRALGQEWRPGISLGIDEA